MAPPLVDFYCHQFQPNSFHPSRCSSCLRPDHMHVDSAATTAAAEQREALQDWDADDNIGGLSEETTSASSDDVSGVWTYEWSLVHSLSPEWELDICDTDIQSSSPPPWDGPERARSLGEERLRVARGEMTRLVDASPAPATENAWMDERRGRDRSRHTSESRANREQESGYFSPERRGHAERQMEEATKRQYRYYERGHPLPSNYIPEPKACVPYRSINLGLPSERRTSETYMQDSWRSESPQRYSYHSNFRRGGDSQRNSPTRQSSVSPDRYKLTESSSGLRRGSSLSRNPGQALSHGSSQLPSRGPSRRTSGRSSPSRRRGSVASRAASPSRATPSHRRPEPSHLQNGHFVPSKGCSRQSRSPSQASNRHSLDSERLYRNLESISRRGSSAVQNHSYEGSQASPRTRTALNSSTNTQTRNSRDVSPSRNGYGAQSHAGAQGQLQPGDSRVSPMTQGSWQGSAHSLLSLPPSRGSSSSQRVTDPQALGGAPSHAAVTDAASVKGGSERSNSSMRRGMDALFLTEPNKTVAEVEEVGMTMEDYIILANIPKIQLESEEEISGLRWRNQSPSPCRDQRVRTPRYHDEVDVHAWRFEPDERGRGRERGRDRREKCRDSENGRLSRGPSAAPLHAQSSDGLGGKHRSPRLKEKAPVQQTQGWMSRLDESGEWRKHWFVLGGTLLRYYRDSEAEESDDPDGEIELTSCVNVSDCDVEKNYGLQLQTKRAVFIFSAMTSRIRRNWVKLLKEAIQNNTHQSDTGSAKENPPSGRASSCQPPARLTCEDSGCEPATSTAAAAANSRRADRRSVDGDVAAEPSPAGQREEGEGWDREQAKRLEERNKWFEKGAPFSETGSRWDSMELKKGSVPIPVIDTMDSEVSQKWAEFETLSFRDMSAQSLIGAQAQQHSTPQVPEPPVSPQTCHSSPEEATQSASASPADVSSSLEARPSSNVAQNIQTNTAEALQMETFSLRQQVETIKRERAAMGMDVESPCGREAPCRAKLEAMEVAHKKALQELQEKHAKELKELEEEKDRMLEEESRAAAHAVEALRAAHREELQREVAKARRLAGGGAHVDSSHRGHMPQADVSHSELDVLSERYSQKCLELSRTEQSSRSRGDELGLRGRELEQLRKENQELKAKLKEEVSRMRYFTTGQKSDTASLGKTGRAAAEVEVLLRAKENEVQYLKKEISCLQNEVQSLTKEKEEAYERFTGAYVELSDTRGRSQLELGSLNEHLRLANAAVQEGSGPT